MPGMKIRFYAGGIAWMVTLLASAALVPMSAHAASMHAHGDATSGAKLVQSSGCEGCHGAALHGSSMAPNLVGIEKRMSVAQITKAIEDPKSPMPRFGFSEKQVADVVAYISGLDGGSGKPIVRLNPANPAQEATVNVTFPDSPPRDAQVEATMQMGSMSHGTGWLPLRKTSDPHTLATKVHFSMGGPWMIHVKYAGKVMAVPISVGG